LYLFIGRGEEAWREGREIEDKGKGRFVNRLLAYSNYQQY